MILNRIGLAISLSTLLAVAIATPLHAREWIRRLAPSKPARTILASSDDPRIVILKFREGTGVRLRAGRFRGEPPFDAPTMRNALRAQSIGPASLERLFTRSEPELDTERDLAQRRSGRELADLNLYYQLRVPPGADSGRLCDRLNALPFVELAAPAPQPVPAPVDLPPPTPDFAVNQGYLAAPPHGIGALGPAVVPGGDGAGTTVVDIEYSWLLDHEDLELPPSANIDSATLDDPFPAREGSHGTAALGVIGALVNGYGVDGIAPAAALLVAPANTEEFGYNPARAISLATGALGPGDAILVEQQSCVCGNPCPNSRSGWGPSEWSQATFDATAIATAMGIVVVEPAGNGNVNLDDPSCQGRFDRNVRDSGAIIVGAGSGYRGRLGFSSYGSRLDVQAWGNFVATTGYGGLFDPGDPRQRYTNGFSGTSSAAPIVAGAVLAIQGERLARGLPAMDPIALRQLLVDTGSPQSVCDPAGEHIGPLPNLPAALSLAACEDGLDNDADGLVDFPRDAGCESSADADEFDARPGCDDDIDNDGDGLVDFPDDSDCTSPTDATEYHLRPGDILIADGQGWRDRAGLATIVRVDPFTGFQTILSAGGVLGDFGALAIDGTGKILALDFTGGTVVALSADAAQQTIISSCFRAPWGIAVDSDGQIFVTDQDAVLQVDPTTGLQTIVSSGENLVYPLGIAIDEQGDLLVADANGAIVRVNPETAVQSLVSLGYFSGLTIDATGDILVAGAAAIVRVDPETGLQTIVSSGGYLVDGGPVDLAIEANGHILVSNAPRCSDWWCRKQSEDLGPGSVIRIDPAIPDDNMGGNQTIVSVGGSFVDPFGIAVVPVPVPEPAPELLHCVGLAAVSLLARHRRRRAGFRR